MAKNVAYVSFFLRIWQADEGRHVLWRASLESAQTGEKRYFASVNALTDLAISNADSAEELLRALWSYPLYPYFDWQVEPLVESLMAFSLFD